MALNPNFDTMGGVESFVMCRLCRNKTQENRDKLVSCFSFSFFHRTPMSCFPQSRIPHRMEKRDDGYYQYYKCSKEQVFLYFRKFDPTVVQIIAPETLRTRMKMFYASGVKAYDSQNYND